MNTASRSKAMALVCKAAGDRPGKERPARPEGVGIRAQLV